MSITDELRTSGCYEYAADNRHFTGKELTAIADRIEAEYKRMQAENAKLRELLRSVANKYCESGTCDGCPILGKDESCPY